MASLKTWTLSVRLSFWSDQRPAQETSSTRLISEYESWHNPLKIEVNASRCCSRKAALIDDEVVESTNDRTKRIYSVLMSKRR